MRHARAVLILGLALVGVYEIVRQTLPASMGWVGVLATVLLVWALLPSQRR